jgi:dephospho-CoA kinase
MSKFIVGLTGGIGSGKSTITEMFAQLGINVVDADIVAREVVAPNSPALEAIAQYFGEIFILANGQLDRTKLRSKVFSCEKSKRWLNNLLHPLIRQSITDQLQQSQSPYCLLVAPLLIENKLTKLVNKVLVIDISEQQQLIRTLQRDNSAKSEIKAIMASQISRAERLQYADDIIDNSLQNLSLVLQQVKCLDLTYRELTASSSKTD